LSAVGIYQNECKAQRRLTERRLTEAHREVLAQIGTRYDRHALGNLPPCSPCRILSFDASMYLHRRTADSAARAHRRPHGFETAVGAIGRLQNVSRTCMRRWQTAWRTRANGAGDWRRNAPRSRLL
jgi:hypothetical protein